MVGLLDDPSGYVGGLLGEAWKRFRGVDPQTGQADYFNRGGLAGLLGMPSWDEQSPTDIAMGFAGSTTPALKGVAGALAKPQGIRAYHGSPHDFDRFDLSKIGTGEGAQAYGHGLYFAESPGVAKSYRDALSKYNATIDGRPIVESFTDGTLAGQLSEKTGLSRADSISAANILADSVRTGRPFADLVEEAAKKAEEFGPEYVEAVRRVGNAVAPIAPKTTPGRMYEVEISADPERFLDWDAPLSRQSEHVLSVLDRFGIRPDRAGMRSFDDALLSALEGDASAKLPKQPSDPLGGNIYESEKLVGGKYRDPAAASKILRDSGVPGIKYLDQGSRSAGEGSRNYVVFDDKLIDILRKYGLLGPLAGGATAGAVGDY